MLLFSGTLSTNGIVGRAEHAHAWNIVTTVFVPFVIFLIAATAELNRPPFDLVEAEQELVGGFNTEYSAFGFALFFLAEFMNTVTMSAVIVTLFLGGPQPIGGLDIPSRQRDIRLGPLRAWCGSSSRSSCSSTCSCGSARTLPRLRYDQLMDLGWKVMIPLSLGWFLFLAASRVVDRNGWNSGRRASIVVVQPRVAVRG